jgi:polygalacturonase
MKEDDKMTNSKGNLDRRTMVLNGAALVGAGLLGSFANSSEEPGGTINNNFFNVRDFGTTGKRDDKATIPVRTAIDTCTAAGGGTVYVPPGDYTVGTIQLKDNVTLNIEAGATLYLSQDSGDFIQRSSTMIFAENVKNIAVTGKWTLNGLARYNF